MSRHEARGTKRTCQNQECALPFYDLNRLECSCPNCGTAFNVEALVQVVSETRKRSQFLPVRSPVATPRGPAEPVAEEPEEAVANDDVADDADAEAATDSILDVDDEDVDNVEVERLPGVTAED
jgi:hypothetical protein